MGKVGHSFPVDSVVSNLAVGVYAKIFVIIKEEKFFLFIYFIKFNDIAGASLFPADHLRSYSKRWRMENASFHLSDD